MKKLLLQAALAVALTTTAFAAPPQRTTQGPKAMPDPLERTIELNSKSLRRAPARAAADAIDVPFTHSLGKNDETTAGYAVIDANGDGRTWKPGGFSSYSVCMPPNSDEVLACDDWLVSPLINLKAGTFYELSFDYDMTLNRTEDRLEVFAGAGQSADDMTIEVVPAFSFPYNNKVFVTKTATFSVPADGNYSLGFHAISEKAKSGTMKLCNVSLKVGEAPAVAPEHAVEVPVEHSLGKSEASTTTDYYTVIDANEDGKTWKPGFSSSYTPCMRPTDDNIAANDDWMITVPVHLFPGVEYSLSYNEGFAYQSGIEEICAVYAGLSNTVEAMTKTIIAPHAVTQRDYTEAKGKFTVDSEGYYYFGFHCTSDKTKSGNLRIQNLVIEESKEEFEPAAAGTLSYEIAPKGELKATITYTAPTLTVNGNPLTELSKIVITTNWAYKTELTDVEPGKTYTIVTEPDQIWQGGNNRFEAVAYVGDVAGEPVLVTNIFAGFDNPLPPTDVKAVLSDDFKHVVLSWNPVGDTGENGGYVDTSKVTYYIFDAFGSYYDPAIATTDQTTFEFDYSAMAEQDFMAYQVTAGVDEYYYSLAENSNIVIIGEPEQLAFHESFTNAEYQQIWVVDPESRGNVLNGTVYDNELQTNADAEEGTEPTYLNSQDGDNGFFIFMPIDIDSQHGFHSAKIDISKAANPVYEFFYQGKGSVLDAMVTVDGGEAQTVRSIDLRENPTDDWTLARIDLTPYKSAKYIQIGIMMRAIHNTDDTMWSVPLDNMRVIDLADAEIRLAAFAAPATVKAGENIKLTARVENLGSKAIAAPAVEFYACGELAAKVELGELAASSIASAECTVATSVLSDSSIEFTARAVAEGDADAGNNEATAKTSVQFSPMPMPEGLTGNAENGSVKLSWNQPDFAAMTAPREIEEDFESEDYPALSITGFGDWTVYDGDGGKTYTFLKDVDNPYRTSPMAFQLYNPYVAGVPAENIPFDAKPHSSNTMVVAWSCQSYNDNWLISPELCGDAQTVSFWGKSFTIGYAESFEVLYSTSDADPKSFTLLETVENYPDNNMVPEDWTEFKAALPEGAKYFAVRHNAYDTYALYLDDFKFKAAGELPADTELLGYNVFVDGEPLSDALVINPATSAIHIPEVSGTYSYRVSAVYNHGESQATAPIEVNCEISGIENVSAADFRTEYFNLQGIRVDNPTNGIYIRRQGSKTATIAIP